MMFSRKWQIPVKQVITGPLDGVLERWLHQKEPLEFNVVLNKTILTKKVNKRRVVIILFTQSRMKEGTDLPVYCF